MKRLTTLVLTSLLFSLVGCSSSPTGNQQQNGQAKEEYDCFYGERNIEHDYTLVNLFTNPYSVSDNGHHRFSATINITNNRTTTAQYNISNFEVIRESDSTHYEVTSSHKTIEIMGENTAQATFNAKIPSDLTKYNYCFTVTVSSIKYNFKLYERPDELREDLTVSYMLGSVVVHSVTVKKGRAIGSDYLYESNDHLSYCNRWAVDGESITKNTIINKNVYAVGTLTNNLKIWGASTDQYLCFDAINHIPSDGKVVLPELYDGKPYYIANFVIYNTSDIKEVYIPSTITRIYSYNFYKCPSLTTIYFAGTKAQWDAIPSSSTVPDNVNIVFNTTFGY